MNSCEQFIKDIKKKIWLLFLYFFSSVPMSGHHFFFHETTLEENARVPKWREEDGLWPLDVQFFFLFNFFLAFLFSAKESVVHTSPPCLRKQKQDS